MFKIGDIAIECNLINTTQYNGEEGTEDNMEFESNYAFCSHLCYGRFVGVF